MEPYIELAIERWAREYNEKHDRELGDLKRKRLPFTHPHLFRGDPFKATTSRQILARTRAIEEGNTESVLKMRATLKAEASNEELEKRSDDA
jgi:hypothetical protein